MIRGLAIENLARLQNKGNTNSDSKMIKVEALFFPLIFLFFGWKFLEKLYIRLFEKFLSFYKEIIDAQCLLFYISLLNYART